MIGTGDGIRTPHATNPATTRIHEGERAAPGVKVAAGPGEPAQLAERGLRANCRRLFRPRRHRRPPVAA